MLTTWLLANTFLPLPVVIYVCIYFLTSAYQFTQRPKTLRVKLDETGLAINSVPYHNRYLAIDLFSQWVVLLIIEQNQTVYIWRNRVEDNAYRALLRLIGQT